MSSIDNILKRSSVRRYDSFPFDLTVKSKVNRILEGVIPLSSGKKLQWKAEPIKECTGNIYCEIQDFVQDNLIEYGFQGEQIVLDLVGEGFGTLWKAIGAGKNIPAKVLFGKEPEKKRFSLSGLLAGSGSRKDWKEILDVEYGKLSEKEKKWMDCCRISPSAMNKQHWFFKLKRNNIEINITAKNNWAFIDFGIVAAHAFLSAKELFSDTKIGFISKDSIFVSYAE